MHEVSERQTGVVGRAVSPIEEGLLFHYAQNGADPYVDQMVCDLVGQVDVRVFELVVERLRNLHEALRTSYVRDPSGEWRAEIHERGEACLRFVDLSSEEHARSAVERLVAEEGALGFDLARASSRCTLYRLRERFFVFAWTYHHVVADSWTLRLLQEQFCALYRGGADCKSTPYRAYIDWLACRPREADLAAEGARLARAESRSEPAPPLAGAGREHARVLVVLPPETRRQVADIKRRCKVTTNVVLLATWALFALEQCQDRECLIGCVAFGRGIQLRGIDKVAGVCANTVPILVDGRQSLRELLGALQQQVFQSSTRAYLGLGDVLAAAGRGPADLHSVVNFTIDERTVRNEHTPHLPFEITGVRYRQAASFDAYLDVEVLDATIEITLHFNVARRHFDGDDVGDKCRRIVEYLSSHPDGHVHDALHLLANHGGLAASFSFDGGAAR